MGLHCLLRHPCPNTFNFMVFKTNRIYHWSPMQTEKSQPKGKQIMLETRFTEFLALSVDLSVGIFWSASESNV